MFNDRRPPGPWRLPIIGNIHQIRKHPWIMFSKWTKTYGPIFHINIAGQDTIILGSHKVAADLLDRRSGIYSGRPRNIVTRLLTGDLVYAFGQTTPIWRRMRKASHERVLLRPQMAEQYHTLQEREVVSLVDQMIKVPLLFNSHIKRTSASLIMSMIYGTRITDSNDSIIIRIQHFADRALAAAAPGAFLVEYLPWMKHLPRWMSGWRRYAESWHEKDSKMLMGLFANVRERVKRGEDGPSVAAKLIENQEEGALSGHDSAWLAATLFAAGAETSAGQMEWFMLSMILYPEVQQAAQNQIDDVVGGGRMPTMKDYDQLPYIRAIVKELLRWATILPLGLPHRLSQDDWYDGHFLPKDSIVIANVWDLNHDPAIYGQDVDIFRPERHLDESGGLSPAAKDTRDESHCSYGFGKRICVGRHVANRALFIEVAAILWSFKISPLRDSEGRPVIPDSKPNHDGGLISFVSSLRCHYIGSFADAPLFLTDDHPHSIRDENIGGSRARSDGHEKPNPNKVEFPLLYNRN
ncbi:cytochrome P450 [Mycena vulgaris]|nr:cytochrome P450 [Mycena vulgaris]